MATKKLELDSFAFVFFDYGGVLDSHGVHTRKIFWRAAVETGLFVGSEDARKEFQEAYTRADDTLMKTGSAKDMGLAAFNQHNFEIIFKELGEKSSVFSAANLVTEWQRRCLQESARVLSKIEADKGVISNFSGNLEIILRQEGLRNFFRHVTESFYVGSSKPDLGIFLHALSNVDADAGSCLYVGDNITNDILPGRELGLKTVLLVEPDVSLQDNPADHTIFSLDELI